MRSYRYRTATLLGPWRQTAEAAAEDAIRAKQARRDEDGTAWHWVVPGAIEEGPGQDGPGSAPSENCGPDIRVRHRA